MDHGFHCAGEYRQLFLRIFTIDKFKKGGVVGLRFVAIEMILAKVRRDNRVVSRNLRFFKKISAVCFWKMIFLLSCIPTGSYIDGVNIYVWL